MKELTEEQVRELRAHTARKGKAEIPPALTEEDDRILDKIWQEAGEGDSPKAPRPQSK